MRWQGAGALIVAVAATGAHAQSQPAFAPLSAAVFDTGKVPATEWRSTELAAGKEAAIHVKIDIGGLVRDANGRVPLGPSKDATFEAKSFDLRVTHDWQDAVRFDAGDQDVALTPHAGVGVTNNG